MTEQKKTRIKLNVIDFAVIAVVLAAVAFLIVRGVGVRQNSKNAPETAVENACTAPAGFAPDLRVQMVLEDISSDLGERIASSQYRRLYNSFTLLDAYITDVTVQPREDGRVDVWFVVEAATDFDQPDMMIGGNCNAMIGTHEVRIGNEYILKTMDIQVNAIVTDMEFVNVP